MLLQISVEAKIYIYKISLHKVAGMRDFIAVYDIVIEGALYGFAQLRNRLGCCCISNSCESKSQQKSTQEEAKHLKLVSGEMCKIGEELAKHSPCFSG